MIEREVAMEHFCRDHGLVSWFEMKSRGLEQTLAFFDLKNQSRQTS